MDYEMMEILDEEAKVVNRLLRRERWLNRATMPEVGLLAVQTVSHSDGSPYEQRYFAVPVGKHRIKGQDVLIGDNPVFMSEWDCNAPHGFKLPKGSMELCWQVRRKALYSY